MGRVVCGLVWMKKWERGEGEMEVLRRREVGNGDGIMASLDTRIRQIVG